MLDDKENSLIDLEKRTRVRVCGILKENDKILLLKHEPFGEMGYLWLPPGGGVEFGESAEDALIREFKEETNLDIEVLQFLFTNEVISKKLHAIELLFQVKRISGELILGSDPEYTQENQLLKDLKFLSIDELNSIHSKAIHNAFTTAKTRDKISDLRGFITFKH
ncbi:MAG: NUDIX domain-containing protein [Ekhidna sp.]